MTKHAMWIIPVLAATRLAAAEAVSDSGAGVGLTGATADLPPEVIAVMEEAVANMPAELPPVPMAPAAAPTRAEADESAGLPAAADARPAPAAAPASEPAPAPAAEPVAEPEPARPTIAWKTPKFTLTARAMSLREGFEAFAAAQGMSVVMTEAVRGTFSGEFRGMAADEFLDRVTTLHNLIWYYDGAALYLCGSGEVQTMLLSLRYMKADEVRAMLRQLGIEDARFPIRTASDDELILVSGPPRYVALIAETIARADALREQRTFAEVETRIFPLEHTWADDVTLNVQGPESTPRIRGVATMLQEIMDLSGGARTREKGEGGQTEEADPLSGALAEAFRPIIRADNRLNAVIVRDAATRMPTYERLIRQLDRPQRLIEIGVTVVELSREDAMDWQLSLAIEGSKSDFSGGAGSNVANLASELGGRGLAGVASYIGDNFTVAASLQALQEDGKARNVSRTSLLTVNNLAARLTDTQSYHARVVGTEVATLEEVSAGTELEIKPRIVSPSAPDRPERIWMTMMLRDGGFEAVTVDAMPMTRDSTLETQASVPVGQSLLLAGYLRDIREEAGWGIPWLRDIPFIGWIFGGSSYRDETVQRLFILTPYIVDADQADLVRTQATRQRDISEPMALEWDSDADHAERMEREAKLRERQEIHAEEALETYNRNEDERELRRLQRADRMEVDRFRWQKDYDRRREEYSEAREEILKETKE